jgi:hypothetical protein
MRTGPMPSTSTVSPRTHSRYAVKLAGQTICYCLPNRGRGLASHGRGWLCTSQISVCDKARGKTGCQRKRSVGCHPPASDSDTPSCGSRLAFELALLELQHATHSRAVGKATSAMGIEED